MAHFGCYPDHTDTLICRGCGTQGSIVWEDVPNPSGFSKELLRIEGEFYERLAKKPPYPIELVCNGCGTAQSGAVN